MKAVLKNIAITIILGTPAPLMAGTAFTYSIESYLASQSLEAKDVNFITTVGYSGNPDWARGHRDNFVPGQFLLAKSTPAIATPRSLKIAYDSGIISIAACTPFSGCSAIDYTNKGTRALFDLDGSSYRLDHYGNPCQGSSSCESFYSSWHLQGSIADSQSPLSWPRYITVISHTKGLAFFNAEDGSLLSTQNKSDGNIAQLGDVVNAIYHGHLLILDHTNGTQILDLAKDRHFVFGNQGIIAKAGGIGDLGSMAWLPVYTAENSQFIAVSQSLVLWEEKFFKIDFDADTLLGLLGAVQNTPMTIDSADRSGNYLLAYGRQNDYLNSLKYSPETNQFLADKEIADEGNSQKIHLDKNQISAVSDQGLNIHKDGKELRTSLSSTRQNMILDKNGGIFLKEESSSGCIWKHLKSHAKVTESFKETGLTAPCGDLTGFSSGAINAITTLSGFHIKVNVR